MDQSRSPTLQDEYRKEEVPVILVTLIISYYISLAFPPNS